MKMVYNDPEKNRKKAINSILSFQQGGTAPSMSTEGASIEGGSMESTPEGDAGMDIQTMMSEFAQSQDPNTAIKILQSLSSDPALAANVVNMLVQQMQGAEAAPAAEEIPAAKNGMKNSMKLDTIDLEDSYRVNGYKKANAEKSAKMMANGGSKTMDMKMDKKATAKKKKMAKGGKMKVKMSKDIELKQIKLKK